MTRTDTAPLTSAERNLRANVRNFLMLATRDELVAERAVGDPTRAKFVDELIAELDAAGVTSGADLPI